MPVRASALGATEGSGPTCSVEATALAQYHVNGWSAVIPPPTETWSMPLLLLLTKPVAFRISSSFK